jgi:hypothetical protein
MVSAYLVCQPVALRFGSPSRWFQPGALALTAQQRDAEAQAVQQRFATAWKDADITLTAPAF